MNHHADIESKATELAEFLKQRKERLTQIEKSIMKVCERLEHSWTGSWIGYHSNLYFGDFDAPSREHAFNAEWGGIYGYDQRWQPKELAQIWEYVTENSSTKFDVDAVNDELDKLQELSGDLKTLYELNNENPVLDAKIKDIDTDYKMYDFVKARRPGTVMSRDSEALQQGLKVPPHIQCQGFAQAIRQNILSSESLLRLKPLIVKDHTLPTVTQIIPNELDVIHSKITQKVGKLFVDEHYAEAVGKAFSIVKDRLRDITGYENGYPAFAEGSLYIKGSAADNVDADFQEAVKRLLGSIDKFRNEKFHTSEAKIKQREKALHYLYLCSLALTFLDDGNYSIKKKGKN
jgi:uncharacterized protein (TIGR02391 family)